MQRVDGGKWRKWSGRCRLLPNLFLWQATRYGSAQHELLSPCRSTDYGRWLQSRTPGQSKVKPAKHLNSRKYWSNPTP
jgi:hypothetical protein